MKYISAGYQRVAVGLVVAVAVLTSSLAPASAASIKNITYGSRPMEKLDIYPSSVANSPVIISIHGGSWNSGDKTGNDAMTACNAAISANYTCFAINYTLVPNATWPTQLGEMSDALNWVKANASSYNGDPRRIALWGFSAGAHYSLITAYRIPGAKVVVSWSGPTDLTSINRSSNVLGLLGCTSTSTCPLSLEKDASPLYFVSKTVPPTLLVHSYFDTVVPYTQSSKLNSALGKVGANHTLISISGSKHADQMGTAALTPTMSWLSTHL